MEDNSSSDDEMKESPLSPKLGGKKLKLNDGSSQEYSLDLKESGSSSKAEKDENVDSGVSADKSESTSSEDRGAGAKEEPSNEVVNVAPSSSNVRTILLNIRRPKRGRNYRKRRTPDRDSDSNDSSRDSDDLSAEESMLGSRQTENSTSEAESEEHERFMTFSDETPSGTSSSDGQSDASDDLLYMQSGDTDTEEDVEVENRTAEENREDDEKRRPPSVLSKIRPKHNYMLVREIINREMGLRFPPSKSTRTDIQFEHRFYGSLHAVFRLEKLHLLSKHKGCVNSINFHPEGHLLASGSDDMNVVVWDWARNRAIQTIKTGHKSNVFQSKFLYLNARSQLNIVTCARDGQVRLLQCPPSGGAAVSRRRLAAHARAAHKLHVSAAEPHVVVSAGEDGIVMQCDVRADHASRLFQVKDELMTIPLYSVCGHPLDNRVLAVAGRDRFVRVYDRRKSTRPLALYCPATFHQHSVSGNPRRKIRMSMMHLTCAVYNHDGTELLGSYNDDDIYLFDTKNDVHDPDDPVGKDGYTHRYSGHKNSATFKGVSYFGPKSEYIVSGSDCAYIYIWEKHSESIVQWRPGDVNGVVNCIEAHPRFPVLASSGLDKEVKIWMPVSDTDPTYEGLEREVRENVSQNPRSSLFDNVLPVLYSAWRGQAGPRPDGSDDEHHRNLDMGENVCTAF